MEIGGTAPLGWKTTSSTVAEDLRQYLKEDDSPNYAPRTRKNVLDSDGTLAIYHYGESPGTALTKRICKEEGKPFFGFDIGFERWTAIADARHWVAQHKVKVLNIAGNSERTYPGMYKMAYQILKEMWGIHGLPVTKIISGAQTGADEAGLRFALDYTKEQEQVKLKGTV